MHNTSRFIGGRVPSHQPYNAVQPRRLGSDHRRRALARWAVCKMRNNPTSNLASDPRASARGGAWTLHIALKTGNSGNARARAREPDEYNKSDSSNARQCVRARVSWPRDEAPQNNARMDGRVADPHRAEIGQHVIGTTHTTGVRDKHVVEELPAVGLTNMLLIRGGCMRRHPVDPTNRSPAAF